MSNDGVSDYPRWLGALAARVGPRSDAEQRLLLLSTLPLLDGVAVGTLVGEGLGSLGAAVAFGVTTFSGAGCLFAALSLPGSRADRLGAASRCYLAWVVPGAVIAALLASVLRAVLLPDFYLFSALVLVGVALEMGGLVVIPRDGCPEPMHQRWRWALQALASPQVVLVLALAASILHVLAARPALVLAVSEEDVLVLALAAVAGGVFTLLGALAGPALGDYVEPAPVRLFGAVGLFTLAARLLEPSIPEWLPLGLLALGIVVGAVQRALFGSPSRTLEGGES